MNSDIFISYRRDDASAVASLLFEKLKEAFDTSQVFMDTTSIQAGDHWDTKIRQELEQAKIVLVLIGDKWLTAGTDKYGLRRIDQEDDWVRNEVSLSFKKNKETIPVLINGAEMPPAQALPDPLKMLPRLQATKVDVRDGGVTAVDLLIKSIQTKFKRIFSPDQLGEDLSEVAAAKYEIVKKIGQGASASVYIARDTVLDRDVAIKATENPDDKRRFIETLRDAARIAEEIPNFIPIYGAWISKDPAHVVMRFLVGGTLRKVIDESDTCGMPLIEAHRILLGIGQALVKAHAIGITHCNIKPSNIILGKGGEPYLSPLCRIHSLNEHSLLQRIEEKSANVSDRTFLEDLCYIPPECIDTSYVGSTPLERHEKVDQYMLGLLGYEMLSGELPETITSLEDLKENGLQAFKSLPTLNELRKDCPGRLTDILHKMTHVSPLKRYANLADALHDLARVSFDSLVLAKESYARCISTLDGGEQFFEAFYTEFLRLSPEAQAMFSHFKDDRARWKRQHLVLRESIYLLFLYAEERDRLREPNVLTRIAELHNKNNINVAHPLYDTFIDALVHSVTGHPPEIPEAFDPRCNLDSAEAEQIETAWRRALEPGIEYMKKRYWSN